MEVFIHVPLFTTAGAREIRKRIRNLESWHRSSRGLVRLQKEFKRVTHFHVAALCPGTEMVFYPPNYRPPRAGEQVLDGRAQPKRTRGRAAREAPHQEPVRVLFPKAPDSLVAKGLAVRLDIMQILWHLDRRDRSLQDAYYVLVDGSGAFRYESIFAVLDVLLSGKQAPDVVLGRRPPNNTGMPAWRREIERYEESLVIRRFVRKLTSLLVQGTLPDSQAGCWGVPLGAMCRLPLTANGYGLELDVLMSAAESKLEIGFSGLLKMGKRRVSEFGGVESCLKKLRFLAQKLRYQSPELEELLAKHERRWRSLPKLHATKLAQYASDVRQLSQTNIPKV